MKCTFAIAFFCPYISYVRMYVGILFWDSACPRIGIQLSSLVWMFQRGYGKFRISILVRDILFQIKLQVS